MTGILAPVRRQHRTAPRAPLAPSPPFLLLLASGPDQDIVILNAHHAAFDGHSCLRLLQSVAAAYSAPGRPRPGSRPSPQPCTPNERPPMPRRGSRTPLPWPAARDRGARG